MYAEFEPDRPLQRCCGCSNASDTPLDCLLLYVHTLWVIDQQNGQYVGATFLLEVHETHPEPRFVVQSDAVAWDNVWKGSY
jgi:hypothetical protein